MTDHPTGRSETIRPMRVAIEDTAGSRNFVDDCRAEVEELSLGCDEEVSKATIRIWPGAVPEAPGRSAEGALSPADVLDGNMRVGFGRYITPDQEVMIYRELPTPPGGRQILFSGFCDITQYAEQSHAAENHTGFTFLAEGMLKRASYSPWSQIVGRWMRTADGQHDVDSREPQDPQNPIPPRRDTRPIGNETAVALVQGLPCIFNPDGKGNRAAAPIEVTIGQRTLLIHVFTYDGDPDGQRWTWAQALRYLTFFHMFKARSGATLDDLGDILFDGNTFDLTDALAELGMADRPEAPPSKADMFRFAMLGEPASCRYEGMSFPEAAVLIADGTGTHFKVATEDDGTGLPINRVYWWASGCGTEKDLRREGQLPGQTAAQILAANNINKFTIRSDFSEVISQPIIRGDVMKWEITTELLPGWLPDPHLDDVAPENVENEVTYASIHLAPGMSEEEIAADPWYAAYHRRGSEFHLHQEVGRRWVLNETHRYFGDYARTTVFDADKYRGWEPSDCNITEEYVTAAGDIATRPVPAGSWARIGRPLDDCLSADREGRSLGVYIEFSFDGGTTWRRMTGTAARALESEAGIYLECDDLMTLMPDGGDVSVWEALVRGRLRVRVTAVIAGDARLTPNIDAERFGPPTTSGCSRVFNVADRYHWASRQLANSQFRIGGPKEVAYQTTECRSDLAELQAFAGNVMAICTARQMPATLTIPWLATTDFSVGDCITGISGLGITFWTSSLGGSRHPDIVGMVFGNTETRLILEDRRLADVVLA